MKTILARFSGANPKVKTSVAITVILAVGGVARLLGWENPAKVAEAFASVLGSFL